MRNAVGCWLLSSDGDGCLMEQNGRQGDNAMASLRCPWPCHSVRAKSLLLLSLTALSVALMYLTVCTSTHTLSDSNCKQDRDSPPIGRPAASTYTRDLMHQLLTQQLNCSGQTGILLKLLDCAEIADTALGRAVSEWHREGMDMVQRLGQNMERLARLREMNTQLEAKLEKVRDLLRERWRVGMSWDSAVDLRKAVSTALDKNMYLMMSPDLGVQHKVTFDGKCYYRTAVGIGGHPSNLLRGDVGVAIEELISQSGAGMSRDDWEIDGTFRTHHTAGTMYELLATPSHPHTSSQHMYYIRPFAGIHLAYMETLDVGRTPVNIIVTVGEEQVVELTRFVRQFVRRKQPNVHLWYLTVVYTGLGSSGDVYRSVLASECGRVGCAGFLFLVLPNISVEEAITRAASQLRVGDVVTMVTDIYHFFDARFLQQCRLHSRRGMKVYFPIAFGLYNPKIVKFSPPRYHLLSPHYGRWVDPEYTTACMYKSDLLALVGGAGGGGKELFDLVQQSPLHMVRAPSRHLLRKWHKMECDRLWGLERYERCILVKTHTLAPVHKLGSILLPTH